MSYSFKHSGFQLKKHNFALLLIAGVCANAVAQTPAPSLPSLPSLPNAQYAKIETIPSLSSQNAITANTSLPQLPSLAGMSSLPTVESPLGGKVVKPTIKGSPTPIVMQGDVIAPQPVDATMVPDVQVPTGTSPLALPGMAPLPLPSQSFALPTSGLPKGIFDADALAASVPPRVSVPKSDEKSDAPTKTWETSLAPSIIPKKTNFNYKRSQLPESIYRNEYDKNNKHLPRRITRDDYVHLLFNSVANNDLNATRALLNAGVRLNATNPYGETPLMLAERMGATQVAALLVARGARE